MKYRIIVRCKTRDLSESIGKFEDSINKSMAGFGYDNFELGLESEMSFHEITTDRPLTNVEKTAIIEEVNTLYKEKDMNFECVRVEEC